MKTKLILVLFFMYQVTINAQSWCGNSYMTVDGTWYTGSNTYIQPGGKFDGANLGTFTNNFTLGGELAVYPWTTDTEHMYYSIDDNYGTFTEIALPNVGSDVSNTNNSKHSGEGTVSIAGLSAGVHTLYLYFKAGSQYDSNYDVNYKAYFTVSETSSVQDKKEDSPIVISKNKIIVNATNATLNIYDLSGRVITNQIVSESFDITSLNKGAYLIKLSQNGKTYTAKILKK